MSMLTNLATIMVLKMCQPYEPTGPVSRSARASVSARQLQKIHQHPVSPGTVIARERSFTRNNPRAAEGESYPAGPFPDHGTDRNVAPILEST